MNFIKKIVDKNFDELVHLQFQKFSKGEFIYRALIYAKQTKGKYTIYTSAEFANEMVYYVAKKLGEEKTQVTGAVVSTSDLTGELDFKDKKQFQGVKRYLIDSEMSGTEIIKLLEKFPKAFFALSFKIENYLLKIKPKAPKSGKPKTKGGKKEKPNFCKLVTTDKEAGQSFVIESEDWKKADITHTFMIKEIIMPKGETDYSKIRALAKRKGTIIREAIIDEKEMKRDISFEA